MSVSVHMRNFRLLQTLPGDVKVVDCAECGLLLTSCWAAFKVFRHNGLRLLCRWKVMRNGHRRPICMTCSGSTKSGRPLPGPGENRPEGQGVKIWKDMRQI